MAKIALDAGHGLKTSGKQTPDGVKEWTLNDKVRDKAVEFLYGYDVDFIFTDNNEGNTDETLASRLQKYLNAGVESFVSIHHNAHTGKWNNATGVEVYVDNNATADDIRLAECIYKRLVEYTGLKGRGIKRMNFYVINQNRIPAVLVEGGFMDGRKDNKVITSADGQDAYGRAVAEGLIEFHNLKKKPVTETPTAPATSSTLYRVQVGSFRNKAYAVAMYKRVKATGVSACMVRSGSDYKVQVGAYKNKSNADKMLEKMKAAGFDPIITTKGGISVAVSTKKSIDEIAKEVIDGKWGNGYTRKNRLTKAGYDYQAVQTRVNALL